MEECCLCKENVSCSTAKKKKKKLYSATAAVAKKQLLECCLQVLNADLDQLILDKDANLCHNCDFLLRRIHTLQSDLQVAKDEVAKKLLLLRSGKVA